MTRLPLTTQCVLDEIATSRPKFKLTPDLADNFEKYKNVFLRHFLDNKNVCFNGNIDLRLHQDIHTKEYTKYDITGNINDIGCENTRYEIISVNLQIYATTWVKEVKYENYVAEE